MTQTTFTATVAKKTVSTRNAASATRIGICGIARKLSSVVVRPTSITTRFHSVRRMTELSRVVTVKLNGPLHAITSDGIVQVQMDSMALVVVAVAKNITLNATSIWLRNEPIARSLKILFKNGATAFAEKCSMLTVANARAAANLKRNFCNWITSADEPTQTIRGKQKQELRFMAISRSWDGPATPTNFSAQTVIGRFGTIALVPIRGNN